MKEQAEYLILLPFVYSNFYVMHRYGCSSSYFGSMIPYNLMKYEVAYNFSLFPAYVCIIMLLNHISRQVLTTTLVAGFYYSVV